MRRLVYALAGVVAAMSVAAIVLFPRSAIGPHARLAAPPKGFDVRREGIEHGKVETVEYDSKAGGCRRKMRIYTPPGFSLEQKYPVLYLLHGSNSDERSWVSDGAANSILDNLCAEKKSMPMIIVMPDGNLLRPGKSRGGPGVFDALGLDLLGDIIPYVEGHFPVIADREHRALAGVSAGANQALRFGLTNSGTFSSIGVFIGGLHNCERFEQENQQVLRDLGGAKGLSLLWVANGENDFTYDSCQEALALLDKYRIRYRYEEGPGAHGWDTARNDLFVFAQLVFRGQ